MRSRITNTTLVVWDTQTGAIVGETKLGGVDRSGGNNKIVFHANQRAFTLITKHWHCTHDVFNGTKLCEGDIPSSQLGAYWTHEGTLQFAIGSETDGTFVISIYELQPSLIPPLHILSSFPVPHQSGKFSFSPLSSHASFVTQTEVTVLDVQGPKLLLQVKVAQDSPLPGQFSPDGQFFACKTSGDDIWVWENTPAGYVPWSNLRPRLPIGGFSWSPTSSSILCWGLEGIQLLHLGSHPNPPHINTKPNHKNGRCLVGYSADGAHIVTTRQWDNRITVLGLLPGTLQQSINMDMEIQDIKVIKNTIFAVDEHKLVSWDLEASEMLQSGSGAMGVTVNETLDMGSHTEHLTLSHNCTQIAFARENTLFLYDIKSQKSVSQDIGRQTSGIQFSLDGSKLWPIRTSDSYYLKGLEIVWDLSSGAVTKINPEDIEPLFNPPSPCGYHIGIGSGWVEDSKGVRLLWVPPNWRIKDLQDKRWDGNFLALVGGYCHDFRQFFPFLSFSF